MQWAPRVNVSARTGRHMEKLVPAIETALAGWETRVPTGRLNAFLGELVAAHPHPIRGGKQPRILFGTQAGTKPPRFVLFASGFLEAGYRRFIERRLREEFGFDGTPIQISVRVREKRGRKIVPQSGGVSGSGRAVVTGALSGRRPVVGPGRGPGGSRRPGRRRPRSPAAAVSSCRPVPTECRRRQRARSP